MANNEYKTFYLKDLLLLIDSVALGAQKDPNTIITHQGDMQMLLFQNANVALYNRGVMKMREALLKALAPIPEEEEKDE